MTTTDVTDSPAVPLAVGCDAGLGDGLCPHCQKPVALVAVSMFRFIVRCNNRKCSVRPRTWKMSTPSDARAAWRQYLKTKICPGGVKSAHRERRDKTTRPTGAKTAHDQRWVESPNAEVSEAADKKR